MSKPNRASRTPTAQPSEFKPPEGEHAYLWYFRNDRAINRLLAMTINKADKLPWTRLATVLAVSLGIQPGVELVDRAARRFTSHPLQVAANDGSPNALQRAAACARPRSGLTASPPRGRQTAQFAKAGNGEQCRRHEAGPVPSTKNTSTEDLQTEGGT
jgi:hypothetical protein